MARTWVVNASPLILLGRIGRIEFLPRLAEKLIIPSGVVQELERGPVSDPARVWLAKHGDALEHAVTTVPSAVAAWDLGLGESHVLSLCYGQENREAILDDGPARRCAAALGVPVRGTLSLIVLAKRDGLVPASRPLFEELLAKGLRAAPNVIERAIELAGE